MTFSRLAIIGPGLLGGSIALAVRKRAPSVHIRVWARRDDAVTEIRRRQLADIASTDINAVATDADFIVFCVPIGAMVPLAKKIAPIVSADAIVTDVGSVKQPVVESLGGIFRGRTRFVGSHPMAGSEQTGIDAAHADLFERAVCIVTPDADSDPAAVAAVREFWTLLGGQAPLLAPDEHDATVTLVSHLPHLIAATLVNLVCSQNPNSLNFCGNGFRDTTRVASGSPGMWTEIFGANRAQVRKSVEAMIAKLQQVVTILDDDTKMEKFLIDAKIERDRLKKGK